MEHYQYKIIDLVERGVVRRRSKKTGIFRKKTEQVNDYELDDEKFLALLAEEDKEFWQPAGVIEICSFFQGIGGAGVDYTELPYNSGVPRKMLFRRQIIGSSYR